MQRIDHATKSLDSEGSKVLRDVGVLQHYKASETRRTRTFTVVKTSNLA